MRTFNARRLALLLALLVAMPAVAAAAEGEMRWGLHVTLAPKWLDPAETEAFNTPFMVLYAVHDALVKPMPAGVSTPSLAESWTESKDHLSYTFTLRKNARFHNGEPVTAADVKFSLERYRGASATLLKGKVKEVQALSPTQVRFVLKEPWPDRRVRLAASHAIDRQAVNKAETLGFSRLTGNFVPRIFQYALTFDAPAYDPERARKLLAEAGYPNGFDGGDFTPFPPYNSMGEAIQGYFQAGGIRTCQRTMERATYFSTGREKKLRGVILVVSATFGNAATRIEPYATKNGIYAYGSLPDIDDLYVPQGRELDGKKREALVHQIQNRIHDQVINIPIYDLAFIWGVGPRVEESGAGLIPGFAYSAPFEDLKLKK